MHAIINAGDEHQQRLALANVLLEPSMMNITKSVVLYVVANQKCNEILAISDEESNETAHQTSKSVNDETAPSANEETPQSVNEETPQDNNTTHHPVNAENNNNTINSGNDENSDDENSDDENSDDERIVIPTQTIPRNVPMLTLVNGSAIPLDMPIMIFENVVEMLCMVKKCKRMHDNRERFMRILFTIITSKKLMEKFSSVLLGNAFGYYRKTIKKI